MSVYPIVRPYVSGRLPLNGFACSLIGDFRANIREHPNLVKSDKISATLLIARNVIGSDMRVGSATNGERIVSCVATLSVFITLLTVMLTIRREHAVVFSWQQCLYECTTLLRYSYIASRVNISCRRI
jgi:hypothetical protein